MIKLRVYHPCMNQFHSRVALLNETIPNRQRRRRFCTAIEDKSQREVFSDLIEERKSGDEVVKTVESGVDHVLCVVTEELHGGEHGNASVLELIELTLLELSGVEFGLARFEVSEVSVVVNGTDQEDHLGPAKSRDGLNGGNTIGDIGAWNARGDVEGESEEFGDDVSDNSKLGNTSVLELSGAVLVEGLLVDVLGEAQRIEESGGCDNTELALVACGDSRARGGLGSRGEGGGRSGGKGGNGELHHLDILTEFLRRNCEISNDLVGLVVSCRVLG
jgi:hypothetical protein